MSIEQKGPGSVGNSYGTRGTNFPRQYNTASELKTDYQEFSARGVPSAISALVSVAGNLTVNSRDGLGRATSYTDSGGTTYTVTYGNFGPATVSGGGQTRTYSYNAAGQMTGFAAS